MRLEFQDKFMVDASCIISGHNNYRDSSFGYIWIKKGRENDIQNTIIDLIKLGVFQSNPIFVDTVLMECYDCGHIKSSLEDPHVGKNCIFGKSIQDIKKNDDDDDDDCIIIVKKKLN